MTPSWDHAEPSGEELHSPWNEGGFMGLGFAQLCFPQGIPLTKQPRRDLCLLLVVWDKSSSYEGQPWAACNCNEGW